jgi:hypothetical protein
MSLLLATPLLAGKLNSSHVRTIALSPKTAGETSQKMTLFAGLLQCF